MSPEARERSFDALATGLASGSISRGRALRLMGAALVGGALGSLGIGEAAADRPGCKRTGKVCTKDKVCCSGNCVNNTCAACPTGTVLLSNGTCARTCISSADCSASCTGCAAANSGDYCYTAPGSQTPCTTDSQCPQGELCNGRFCVAACS
jgi:Cys-rich repeat protein